MGSPELESKTLVLLAGGRSSRLNEYLQLPNHVKCLTEFSGKIFLNYLLNQAFCAGIEHVIVLGGPNSQVIQNAINGFKLPMKFSFPVESERLGTGGALALIEPYLREDRFFLTNADTYFEENPFALINSQRWAPESYLVFMCAAQLPSKTVRIESKKSLQWQDLHKTPGFVYSGVSLMQSSLIRRWGTLGLPAACSFESDVFSRIRNNAEFWSLPFSEVDFGTEEGFKRMQSICQKEPA